jgi:hypothetical protein
MKADNNDAGVDDVVWMINDPNFRPRVLVYKPRLSNYINKIQNRQECDLLSIVVTRSIDACLNRQAP